MTPEERLAKLKRLKELKRELLVREARVDFFAFQRCVMKDSDGNYWEPGEIHRRWDGFFGENDFAIQWAPIEHGKSEQRTVAKTLWDIGRDQNTRQVLISETHTQAVKMGGAVKTYIEDDKDYHRVFPHVKPGKQWTEALFTVERSMISPHPTVLCTGVGGSIQGSRADRMVLDDVVSFSNSMSEAQRKKVIAWILSSECIGRMVKGARFEMIGTAWHREDAMHVLAKREGFASSRDRACKLTVRGKKFHATEILWVEQWPAERLIQRRKVIGELEFTRQFLNEALAEGMSRFKAEWFEQAFRLAEKRGLYLTTLNKENHPAFTGADVAVGKKSHHDETVLVTAHLLEDYTRHLAEIESGHLSGGEIVAELISTKNRHNAIVMVETNAAQEYLRDWMLEKGEGSLGFITTGPKKLDPAFGIESLAVELQNGQWAIPRCPETEEMAKEAVYYDPTAHTGDRLMAWWLCREGIRAYGNSHRTSPETDADSFKSEAATIRDMDF